MAALHDQKQNLEYVLQEKTVIVVPQRKMAAKPAPPTMKYIFYITLMIIYKSADSSTTSQLKPNIIVIMIDDLGYNDVSYHGSEIWTPNIDQLAVMGVRLENYYVAPQCGPSRAAFFSGIQYNTLMHLRYECFYAFDMW